MKIEKDKNGFTLTEILGVLVILGLLLLLIVPSILNKVRVNEKEIKKAQENMVENSTNIYMDQDKDTYPNTEGNVYCIAIQTLIANGKVNENLKDATSKDLDFKKKSVEVTIGKNGNRSFKVVNACNEIKYKNITFEVGPKDNSQWTQYKYVKITYPNMGEIYANEYSIDGGRTWKAVVGDTKITENFNANGKVMARMTGRTIIKGEYPVKRIDTTPPTCNFSGGDWTTWTNKIRTVTLTGTDNESGINQNFKGTTWNFSQTTGTENLSYTIKDNVGNEIRCSKNANIYVDTTKPTCSWSGESTTWTESQRTIKVIGTDSHSGIDTNQQGTTWTYPSTTSTAALSYIIKDKAGNEMDCSKTANIYVDTTKPTCSWSGESTTWTKNKRTITVTGSDSHSGMNASYKSKSWAYASTTKTGTLSYIIRDNVGNETTCTKTANIYVDTTPPVCGSCGMRNGAVVNSGCGSTYYQKISDAHSGINVSSGEARHCYVKENGDWAASSWGRVCHNGDISGQDWGGCSSGSKTCKITTSEIAHGLNSPYATVAFQYYIKDKAGNTTTCGK